MRDFANLHDGAWLLRLTGRAGLAMLFAGILAFLAPFSTYRFGAIERLGYWTLQMVAWLVLSLAASWLLGQIPAMCSRSAAQRRIVAIIVASLPMVVVTGLATNRMNGWQPSPDEVAELFISILLIGGAYTYLSDWLAESLAHGPTDRQPLATSPGHEQGSPPAAMSSAEERLVDTALFERLPAHVRDDILCLQGEDHYVRVHSRGGNAMVLMRFSDALRGIGHLPGAQVHRSWWVAAGAVTEMRRTGRTAQLTLANGTSVPVSQPYLAHAISAWGAFLPGRV